MSKGYIFTFSLFLQRLLTLSNSSYFLEDKISSAFNSESYIAKCSPIPEEAPVIQIILLVKSTFVNFFFKNLTPK